VYEFACGSPVCRTRFSSPDKDELMREVVKHVHKAHRIPEPSKSIMDFVVANTIHEVPQR
jgi:predicted small metal-binding protein